MVAVKVISDCQAIVELVAAVGYKFMDGCAIGKIVGFNEQGQTVEKSLDGAGELIDQSI